MSLGTAALLLFALLKTFPAFLSVSENGDFPLNVLFGVATSMCASLVAFIKGSSVHQLGSYPFICTMGHSHISCFALQFNKRKRKVITLTTTYLNQTKTARSHIQTQGTIN